MDDAKTPGPWTVICIPGREDDGSDSAWFAWDRDARASSPPLTRREAARTAKQYNAGAGQTSSDFTGQR